MTPLSSSREAGTSIFRAVGAVALIFVGTAAAAVWYADAARPIDAPSPGTRGELAVDRGSRGAPTEAGFGLRSPACRTWSKDASGGGRACFAPARGMGDPMTVLPSGDPGPSACGAAPDRDPAALAAPDDA